MDPRSPARLRQLGESLFLQSASTIIDLTCVKGELLCTWAHDHGVTGIGVDLSSILIHAAWARAEELGIEDTTAFIQGDVTEWVSDHPVDIGSCVGTSWIGGGMEGTVALLKRSEKNCAPGRSNIWEYLG